LFISGREIEYVRNSVIINGLKSQCVDVTICTGIGNSYISRYSRGIIKFISKINDNYDAVIIGFLGQHLVPIIRPLTRKPIILDAVISVYDTLCYDRKTVSPTSLKGKLCYKLDKIACELSDFILVDTNAHKDYFINTFNINPNKFEKIYLTADDSVFYPRDVPKENNLFNVFYYGTHFPLQGVEYIVQSAKLLEEYKDIKYTIIGKGMTSEKVRRIAKDLNIQNIEFIDWVPYDRLPLEIAKADICLGGHFGNTNKAKKVIPGKTFQFMSMKKPVIVGDHPANRELLTNGENALFVKPENPEDLAEKILELRNNEKLREKIAKNGYELYKKECSTELMGIKLKRILENIL
jgi:glycosyltransferase involved in cell wall biosynthesis